MFRDDKEGVLLRDILQEIESDDTVADVGANIGVYTCFGATEATEGEVIAFEPYPPNVELIRQNLRQNDLSATVLDLALADE